MKTALILFTFVVITFSSCAVHEQFVVNNRPRTPYSAPAPPPPIGASVWIPAEWVWNGYAGRYNWHPAHWSRPRYGYIWNKGYWKPAAGGWYWAPGRWNRIR